MIDKTTEGVTAAPEEVEAVLHNLCGYHLAEPDPVSRYTALTREQVLYDALVATIKRERGRALAELVGTGRTLTQVAEMTNLRTRQRVQRLIGIAKAAEAALAEIHEGSREFEDRLAAVEATLDQVVSGVAPGEIPAAREPVDDQLPDAPEPQPGESPLLEPTRAMPALASSLNPTREMPSAEDAPPWWRRNRDTTGAA